MSTYVPQIPNDGKIYTLKGTNGKAWWYTENQSQPPTQPNPPAQEDEELMLIVCGQSNGQSSNNGPLTTEEKAGHPRIKSFYRGNGKTYSGKPITNYPVLPKGSIGPAIDPLQHVGISDPNSVGFPITFCKEYLKDHPNSKITIVPCCLGGTGFRPSTGYVITWDKTIQAHLNLYNEALKDCNSVLQKHPNMKVLGMLWHQGENDVGNWEYPQKLDKLVKDFRNDLLNGKGKDMPFVCGTMLQSWKNLNSATDYIDQAHKNIKWRFNDGFTDCAWFDWITEPPYDDGMSVHFNATAQRYMGSGYYATYKKLEGLSNGSRSLEVEEHQEKSLGLTPDMSFEEVCKKLSENEGKITE